MLLDAEVDVNAQGGSCGSALQAASDRGHKKVVKMLKDAGADINAHGGDHGNALQVASEADRSRAALRGECWTNPALPTHGI